MAHKQKYAPNALFIKDVHSRGITSCNIISKESLRRSMCMMYVTCKHNKKQTDKILFGSHRGPIQFKDVILPV